MEPCISVVIPVYQVEPYLTACLDSVVGQTYPHLEILLVNDGSTDTSGAICEAYAARDARITVLHQEHTGPSGARNAAMELATGEYITFVDSDDFLEPDIVETLYAALLRTGADIAACGTVICAENGKAISQTAVANERICRGEEQLRALLTETVIGTAPWGKLYRRELFETVRFPVGKYHEDVFIAHEVLHRSTAIVICPRTGYWYRQVPTSIMHAPFEPRHLHAVEGGKVRLAFIKRRYPHLSGYARSALVYAAARCYVRMIESSYADPVAVKQLQTELRGGAAIFFVKSPCSLSTKLFVAVATVSMRLAGALYRFKTNRS